MEMKTNKQTGVAILIPDKIDFKIKLVTRDYGGHCKILKGFFQQKDITLVNIYAPNIGAPKYMKKILANFKGESYSNRVIIGFKHSTVING